MYFFRYFFIVFVMSLFMSFVICLLCVSFFRYVCISLVRSLFLSVLSYVFMFYRFVSLGVMYLCMGMCLFRSFGLSLFLYVYL